MVPATLMQAEVNCCNEINYDCLKEGGLVCNIKDASIEILPGSLDRCGGRQAIILRETSEFVGSQLVPVEGPQSQEHVLAVHSETLKIDQKDGQPLGPYEIFVTSPQLRTEVGVALIDTGAQVSLIARTSLHPKVTVMKNEIHKISGITGNIMNINGEVEVNINNNGHHKFYIIERVP
jgi:hypothetical protein